MLVDYRQQIKFKSMVEHGRENRTNTEDNDTDNYDRFWAKRNLYSPNIAGDVTYNF